MKKVLFIDRDGTLIVEPPDQQIDSLEKLEFIPGAITALSRIARAGIYELVMVTNQDGLGTSRFPEETFWPAQQKMLGTLKGEGVEFNAIFIDRSLPEEKKPTRKPGTAMLTSYLEGGYDLANSYVIGDRLTDLQLARNMGAKGILLGSSTMQEKVNQDGLAASCALVTTNWEDIINEVLGRTRKASVNRVTRETKVAVDLQLNTPGESQVKTGLGFFDHLLDQLARHGNMSLRIETQGDLHIDEHHTVEDTALALGEAFRQALADKRGLARYGFCLPMDDCLAQVAVDFGGRPWLVWDAEFRREKIGDVPTELFSHFFKSFSDAALCNLNIRVEGTNEHHKIESVFKAFARAIRMAVQDDLTGTLPTTKGTL
jgi:imidazoleglycerol-phosphate dehydratase/histidinol-phosphatase